MCEVKKTPLFYETANSESNLRPLSRCENRYFHVLTFCQNSEINQSISIVEIENTISCYKQVDLQNLGLIFPCAQFREDPPRGPVGSRLIPIWSKAIKHIIPEVVVNPRWPGIQNIICICKFGGMDKLLSVILLKT